MLAAAQPGFAFWPRVISNSPNSVSTEVRRQLSGSAHKFIWLVAYDMATPSRRTADEDLYPLPLPTCDVPRPLHATEQALVDTLGRLQFFLATAPTQWSEEASTVDAKLTHTTVRALSFRFEAFARPVKACKKWEEGVFSDLRNLKPGVDATLEEPKSPLLDYLFQNGCIRTQKKRQDADQAQYMMKQVFYWFSVQHDRLFLDALDRDMKREKSGQEPTTVVCGEPARSFRRPGTPDIGAGGHPFEPCVSTDFSARETLPYHNHLPSPNQYQGPLSQGALGIGKYNALPTVQDNPSPFWSTSPLDEEEADLSVTRVARMRANVPSRVYTCPHHSCKRRFKRLEHMRRHEMTHTNERPFHCWICPKTFNRHDNLLQHTTIHGRLPGLGRVSKEVRAKTPPANTTQLPPLSPGSPVIAGSGGGFESDSGRGSEGDKMYNMEALTVGYPQWTSGIPNETLRSWTAPPDCAQVAGQLDHGEGSSYYNFL
ncbi:hypothetical protein IAT38_006123 [Cryptococcus sp. DSM 104549]